MDKNFLVGELQKAFKEDERKRSTSDVDDVEYRENTNTLLVNEQKTYEVLKQPEMPQMSEEELFGRLHRERHGGK